MTKKNGNEEKAVVPWSPLNQAFDGVLEVLGKEHKVVTPSIVLGAGALAVEMGIRLSELALPEREPNESLKQYLNRLAPAQRAGVEATGMVEGYRLAQGMMRVMPILLYEHRASGRWIEELPPGINDYRDYVYYLFQELEDSEKVGHTTVKRWVDLVLWVEIVYTRIGRNYPNLKALGLTLENVPQTPAQALMTGWGTWGRVAYRLLSLWEQVKANPGPDWPGGEKARTPRYRALGNIREILGAAADVQAGKEEHRKLDQVSSNASQKGVEPLYFPPNVQLTPRQAAVLSRLDFIHLPGDLDTEGKVEVQYRCYQWPACPGEDGGGCANLEGEISLLMVHPDNLLCHECGIYWEPNDVVRYVDLWSRREMDEDGFRPWESCTTPSLDDYVPHMTELAGVTVLTFTVWEKLAGPEILSEPEPDPEPEVAAADDVVDVEPELVNGWPDRCPECDMPVWHRTKAASQNCIECGTTIFRKESDQ